MDFFILIQTLCVCLISSVSASYNVVSLGSDASITNNLSEEIMNNYPKQSVGVLRPIQNSSDPIIIAMSFILTQVIELEDSKQILKVSGWFNMHWVDEFISWNASETGVECLYVPQNNIWIPDIVLLNNVDEQHLFFVENLPVQVCSDGAVRFSSMAIFSTFCHLDVTRFPFDKQECYLDFISWNYNKSKLVFSPLPRKDDQIHLFALNGVWSLQDVSGAIRFTNYSCCTSHSSIRFSILLKRRHEFHYLFIIIPYIFCTFLASLMFFTPPTGEKISYGITAVLGIIVFHELVSMTLPPVGDSTPALGTYFTINICLAFGCVITECIIYNLTEDGGNIKLVWMCLKRHFSNDNKDKTKERQTSNQGTQDEEEKTKRATFWTKIEFVLGFVLIVINICLSIGFVIYIK